MFKHAFLTTAAAVTLLATSQVRADASSANFNLNNLPKTWQDGQSGTNQCEQWMPSSQDSLSQNAFINSAVDFCLWAPRSPGTIGDTERDEVAWCTKPGYGTRLIPDGTLHSVHFVQTKSYVQVTGTGDFTKINIVQGDEGGELDPHGADGNGNPIGGIVFTSAYGGKTQQIHQWTNFMSSTEYCFKACIDAPDAEKQCAHQYDLLGCSWNMPANYDSGFEECQGDVAQYPGIYGASTYYQNEDGSNAPPPHPAPASYNCAAAPSPAAGVTATMTGYSFSTATSTSSAPGPASSGSDSGSGTGTGTPTSASAPSSSITTPAPRVSTSLASLITVVLPPQFGAGLSTSTATSVYMAGISPSSLGAQTGGAAGQRYGGAGGLLATGCAGVMMVMLALLA